MHISSEKKPLVEPGWNVFYFRLFVKRLFASIPWLHFALPSLPPPLSLVKVTKWVSHGVRCQTVIPTY